MWELFNNQTKKWDLIEEELKENQLEIWEKVEKANKEAKEKQKTNDDGDEAEWKLVEGKKI